MCMCIHVQVYILCFMSTDDSMLGSIHEQLTVNMATKSASDEVEAICDYLSAVFMSDPIDLPMAGC